MVHNDSVCDAQILQYVNDIKSKKKTLAQIKAELEASGQYSAEEVAEAMSRPKRNGKPRGAPNVKKWEAKHGIGSVTQNPDGSWTYTTKDKVSVTYREGIPDFAGAGLAGETVDIGQYVNRSRDVKEAERKLYLDERRGIRDGYIWHHTGDGVLMEVEENAHRVFSHWGRFQLSPQGTQMNKQTTPIDVAATDDLRLTVSEHSLGCTFIATNREQSRQLAHTTGVAFCRNK
ncbi:MAG: hypothetical protein KDA83_20545 [Planctomycetales bacterium]|nr:hypothetical protein [Planctomycetales bacterium]